MSGREVNELVVALRPVGADETTDAMEDAQDSFEETAQVAEDSSQGLEEFSQRFSGAMAVATTALSIAAGGLLSTIPIIGEFASGVGAIIQSIGLRLDQLIRDLGATSAPLFELANWFAATKDPMADFLSVLVGLSTVFLTLGAAIAYAASKSAFVSGALATIGGVVSSVLAGISLLTVGLAALVLALAALAVAWITDWNGIRTTTTAVLEDIFNFAQATLNNLVRLGKLIGERMKIIFQGWTNAIHRTVVSSMNGIIATVENTINSIIRTINRFSDVTGISLGTVSLQRMAMPEQRQTAQRLSNNRRAIQGTLDRQTDAARVMAREIAGELDGALPDEIRAILEIDGRQTAEQTSRWRGTNVANRGR